jgi:hypothetical protein
MASVTRCCAPSSGTCASYDGATAALSTTGLSWSAIWNTSLPADDTYNLVAVATGNNANVTSPSAATVVGVDTTPPNVSTPSVNGYS